MANYIWTTEADEFLTKNWHVMRVIDIAEKLGFSRDAVLRRARKLNIEKKPVDAMRPQYYQWSEEMDDNLKSHYQTKTNPELANILGVSTQAVLRRLKTLGLSRGNDGHTHYDWSYERTSQLVSKYSSGEELAKIAQTLGVSLQAVKRKTKALELEPRRKNTEKQR